MTFLDPLDLRWSPNRLWTNRHDVHYRGARDVITIPAGFRFDGASVPRALWWAVPPTGPYLAAAMLHDWCYEFESWISNMPRADADGLFRRVMGHELLPGVVVPEWLRWAMYGGVRLGGWKKPWSQYGFGRPHPWNAKLEHEIRGQT